MKHLACLILFTTTLAACSSFSKASEGNLYQVHLGQSKAELREALGEPASKSLSGESERWFYNVYARDNRKTYPYTATFEGDILKHWDFDTARNSSPQDERQARRPSSLRYPY